MVIFRWIAKPEMRAVKKATQLAMLLKVQKVRTAYCPGKE